jgi:hypothetical protein
LARRSDVHKRHTTRVGLGLTDTHAGEARHQREVGREVGRAVSVATGCASPRGRERPHLVGLVARPQPEAQLAGQLSRHLAHQAAAVQVGRLVEQLPAWWPPRTRTAA